MSKSTLDPATLVANSLDADPSFSAETIVQKFLVRWKLFLACALIVPAIAVGISHLIPTTYKASAQILIRHQGGALSLYSDAAPFVPSLTGATAAEVLRSDPVASQMIEAVGVDDKDIARPAYKVLFGKVAAVIMPLLGREPDDAALAANPKLKYTILAKELKPTVEASTLLMDRSAGGLRDEMVEVTLKSTNREKVAAMVNGLCDAFIADSNRRAKEEMLAASQTIEGQAAALEAELARLQSATVAGEAVAGMAAQSSDTKALAAGVARVISDLEAQLARLRESYTENAPEVQRARAELERTRVLLANQEAIDATRETLAGLRKRQRQLLLAAKLFEANQSDFSIAERAITPKKSKLTLLLRYGVPAAAGLLVGALLGGISILLLNLLDPRLFTAGDVSPASGLPLLGVIPGNAVEAPSFGALAELPRSGARPALLQALGKLDVLSRESSRIVVVTSAENESSTGAVALQLAALLGRNREGSVLLIDANFDRPDLSSSAAAKDAGLLEVLAGSAQPADAIRPTKLPRLAFLPCGRAELRDEVGATRDSWQQLLEYAKRNYGSVVVNAAGLLNSREAAGLVKGSDRSLLVTNRKATRKDRLAQAAALLAEISAPVLGVIHCDAKE